MTKIRVTEPHKVIEYGEIRNGVMHRTTYTPGQDISGAPDAVQDSAKQNWTQEIIDLYKNSFVSFTQSEDWVRAHRNDLLAKSDWTQLPDAPVDSAAWETYRQALRDITEQTGFPENVTWPTPPQT